MGEGSPRQQRVQKLHLVGFTTDQKGLILSARRGARSGGFHLPVDASLVEAVEDLRARQEEEAAEAEATAEEERPVRVESALPVKEIQARLRQGRSVADVAKAAGVEVSWVERFAAPVLAERAQVIRTVQAATLERARLGKSRLPIGEAVRHHLAERNVALSPEEFDRAWSSRQMADGRWAVRFAYRSRGKDQKLRFDLSDGGGPVDAADRLSSQLGYLAPLPRPAAPRTRSGPTPRPTAKRATVASGYRAEAGSAPPTSRPARERERAAAAMRKAAAQHAKEAERAAARRAKEKEAEAALAERAAKAEAVRREREAVAKAKAKAAAEKAEAAKAAKAAADKERRAAERAASAEAKRAAARAKRAEATLRAAERARADEAKRARAEAAAAKKKAAAKTKAPAKKAAVKKAAVKKPATKRSAATKPATKKPAATPTAVRPAPKQPAPPSGQAAVQVPPPAPRAPEAAAPATAPEASERQALPTVRPAGPTAIGSTAPGVSRPVFRPGSVEPVSDGDAVPPSSRSVFASVERDDRVPRPEPSTPTPNGDRPTGPGGRPRRTRPLRAP